MLDATVQLFRNGLCCLQDLGLLQDSWLSDANVTAQYYDLPEPLHKTTPLEAIVSIAQIYVVWSGVPGSWRLFWSSYGKLQRIHRLMEEVTGSIVSSDVDRLVNASLMKEGRMAIRSMFVAFNVFFISLSFVWIAGNSWHVTEAGWIGGMPALIHALTVMNICLVPLLYYMYKDANEQFVRASRMRLLTAELETGKATSAEMGLTTLEALSGWLPFWDSGVGMFEKIDPKKEVQQLVTEKARLQQILDDILGVSASKKDQSQAAKQQEQAAALRGIQRATQLEGYREYIYFVLNAIAFYGYSVCVIVYYWPDELQQPDWLRLMLLNYSNPDADWHGNFAGDLMWTIEPVIVLLSPFYIAAVRNSGKKKVKVE